MTAFLAWIRRSVAATVLFGAILPYNAGAAVTPGGDVSPSGTWNASTEARIGNTGAGTLCIEAGDALQISDGYLGYNPGAVGAATVTGAGAKCTVSSVYVGYGGTGSLSIANGGIVDDCVGYLGYLAKSSGTVTVDGKGTQWIQSGNFLNGYEGAGSVSITNGGLLRTNGGCVGYGYDASGTVTVDGPGSQWLSTRELFIGHGGKGTLNITNGGQVTSARWNWIGFYRGAVGEVTVSGNNSKWNCDTALYAGFQGDGTLTVKDGGEVTVQALYASPSSLKGDGTIRVNGVVMDTSLVFDAARGLQQTMEFGAGGKLMLDVNGNGHLGAGYKGTGSLLVTDGRTVTSVYGELGYFRGASGSATVSGDNSKWINTKELRVGYGGKGSLTVEKGGEVRSGGSWVGWETEGAALVTGARSKWTDSGDLRIGYYGNGTLTVEKGGEVNAKTLFASPGSLKGDGVINAKGLVTDGRIRFDDSHGLRQTLRFGAGGQGQLKLDLDGTGALGVGHKGAGRLTITDGKVVTSSAGYLGEWSGSVGTAVVDDEHSKWINTGSLNVGSPYGGHYGRGTLAILDGGAVTASSVFVNKVSSILIDAGEKSQLIVGNGTGTMTNNGVVYLFGGDDFDDEEAPGAYQPILAGSWEGTGKYLAFGGKWDDATHKFTVAEVVKQTAGKSVSMDLASKQRALITAGNGWTLGMGFAAAANASTMQFTATSLGGGGSTQMLRAAAAETLPAGTLGAWSFSGVSGYTEGTPIQLSFNVGTGYELGDFSLWRKTGGAWSKFTADDLAYNGRYASFTVQSLDPVAVSAVPEPGTIAMGLGAAAMGLLGYARRRQRRS